MQRDKRLQLILKRLIKKKCKGEERVKDIHKVISNYIEAHQEELIESVQNAVQIQSVIGNEHEMQFFMKNKFKQIGLEVEELEPNLKNLSGHEAFVDSGIPFQGRKNVIGIFRGEENKGKSLTLHGHVDVVSPQPLEKWTMDPWGGEIEGNRLYGRGSADMKSGLLANWFALKAVLESGHEPKGMVHLQSVIEEESGGGGGALSCLEEGYITDGFISTEPHALRVTVAHAGIMYFRVRVLGKTAHGGMAHLGVNAIDKMIKIYQALIELDHKRAKEKYYDLFHKGSGQSVHLNRGTFRAGDWVSSVAGFAEIECRISFIPGETRSMIKQLIEDTVVNSVQGDEWFDINPPKIEWFGWSTEPWYQNANSPYVQSFLQTAQQTLNRDIKIIGRASGNDARFTQYYNMPGICFGPIGENLHGPDEFVEINSFVETAKVLANHIVDWTGG